MLTKNRLFFAIIQLVLLIDSTQQSYVKQAVTAVKTFGSTMKNSMTILRQNKNTIKNIAYGVQKKYLQTKHSFASKSVKHLGVEAIKKFKYTAPQAARGGKQLFSLEAKKNIQMRSGSQINGKDLGFVMKRSAEQMRGKEISSLINMVSKSKFQLPALAGGGIMRMNIIEESAAESDAAEDPSAAKKIIRAKVRKIDPADPFNGAFDDKKYPYDVKESEQSGTISFGEGEMYEGGIVDGKMNGKGKLNYANGDVHEGIFKDNLPNGDGYQKTKRDERFIGKFVDGKLTGDGVFDAPNLEYYYEGEFKDSLFDGCGVMRWENLDIFNGEFAAGKKHGYGEWLFQNGDFYNGEFENDLYHGEGKLQIRAEKKIVNGIWEKGKCVKEIPVEE